MHAHWALCTSAYAKLCRVQFRINPIDEQRACSRRPNQCDVSITTQVTWAIGEAMEGSGRGERSDKCDSVRQTPVCAVVLQTFYDDFANKKGQQALHCQASGMLRKPKIV